MSENLAPHYAHAVFAGGGVRGIAHVGALEVAEQRGYRWRHVAGTSAGAIIAALVAAGYTAKELYSLMQEIDYSRFAACPEYDLLHITEMSNLLTHGGLHESSYIEAFVREKLQAKGISTFSDLLVAEQAHNPDLFQHYRLTVIVSDITQQRIVRLPQDAHLYGIDPNALDIARAVRMSASIPFFFIPLQLTDANGLHSCIVDGGLLSNFPLFLFEHSAGRNGNIGNDSNVPANEQENISSIPTFGFQLVANSQQHVLSNNGNDSNISNNSNIGNDSNNSAPCGIDMLKALVSTMLSAHDKLYMDDETFAHTITIPTNGIPSTQFDLTKEQAHVLYESGKGAATTFFKTWNFEAYMARYKSGNTPTTSRLARVHEAMKQHAQHYSSCKDV